MDVYWEFTRWLWGAPGIASQATHLEFACYLGFGQSSTFKWHQNLIPNATGQPPAPGDGVSSRFSRGKDPRISLCLVILLFTYRLHKHSYSFPPARIERCVSVCFSFFFSRFFFWVRRSLCPLRSRSHTRPPRAHNTRHFSQRTTKDCGNVPERPWK